MKTKNVNRIYLIPFISGLVIGIASAWETYKGNIIDSLIYLKFSHTLLILTATTINFITINKLYKKINNLKCN